MPNTREKLNDLLDKFINGGFRQLNHANTEYIHNSDIADHLIANGVTVQKWIPVTERLPEKYGKYLCIYVFDESAGYPHIEAISYYPTMTRFQGEGSCGMRVTHWMPLPEPPKEV